MKTTFFFLLSLMSCLTLSVRAQQTMISGPDGRLTIEVSIKDGEPFYRVCYDGHTMLDRSPLGFVTNEGDFSHGLSFVGCSKERFACSYVLDRIKHSEINCEANRMIVTLADSSGRQFNVVFHVSNNDIAFCYKIPKWGETGAIVIEREMTGFDFPNHTTTFLSPQSDPMIGWKRTKPSYEEEYEPDVPIGFPSRYGRGFTFPALFRVGCDGWVLVSETGVDSRYCASRLGEGTTGGLYLVEFPMSEENNGNGTSAPGFSLPGTTPWRTITVGKTLKPIVETTIMWDVVEPRYESEHLYTYGRGTWSWIIWQDESINYEDQLAYIDLAADMGYEYTLIDCGWDINIGRGRIEELVRYAATRNVGIFLWYSSSGYWNDIVQSPTDRMHDPIARKHEMKWLHSCGVKGIKVDFFGGDKQETMRLYEAILSDADDAGLMVLFHGCTLPRGWERMYPNYVGSEAVLASENMVFQQHFADCEAFNACLHPFIRNAVGCMEFGGVILNHRLNRNSDGGTIRRTTDTFELATGILFQNPIQFFALTPDNLLHAPAEAIDFMKEIPTTWDETVFIDGYPGQYVVMARRCADHWFIVGVSALDTPQTIDLDLPMIADGQTVKFYTDDSARKSSMQQIKIENPESVRITLYPKGGFVLVAQDAASR